MCFRHSGLFATVVIALILRGAGAGATRASVAIAFTAPATVSLHEPVIVQMTIQNTTGGPIEIDYGADRLEHVRVEHTSPAGAQDTTPLTLYDPNQAEVLQEVILDRRLDTGATYAQDVLLSKNFDFSALGTHRVSIEFRGAIADASHGLADVTGRQATLLIDVQARDETRLRRACAALADQMLHGRTLDERVPATALAYVADPVAQPFLLQLIEARRQTSRAVRGLARIGTPDARDALVQLTSSTDREISDVAKDALRRFRRPPR